jgi:pimeloyl-ACP methyl ester carboxylesterase
MIGIESAAMGLALVLCGGAPVTEQQFGVWFDAASAGRLVVSEPTARRAAGFRYVFVAGLGNERMPGYFGQNINELETQGVPQDAITVLAPTSSRSVAENSDDFRDEMKRIAERDGRKLVVIAHSRGACDVMNFAIRNPDFVDRRIEAMFLIQGPFGGSALADYVVGQGKPMDDRMPRGHRIVAHFIGKHERSLVAKGYHGGLPALTRESSRAYWAKLMKANPEAIETIGPKVFYIAAQSDPSRLRLFQRSTGTYLDTYYGPNDGMVAVEDQVLEGVGTRLGPINAGHADLTRRFPATNSGRQDRRALIQCIIAAVGRSDPMTLKTDATVTAAHDPAKTLDRQVHQTAMPTPKEKPSRGRDRRRR